MDILSYHTFEKLEKPERRKCAQSWDAQACWNNIDDVWI